MVRDVWTPGSPSLVSADRRLWDNNPRLNHKDRYYDIANDNDFGGMVQVLKNYIVSRGSWMVSNLLTDEGNVPDTPTITYSGGAGFPSNDLQFTSSAYSGGTAFAAMEWRISEVYNESTSNYLAGEPYLYEIEDPTESGELAVFTADHQFPVLATRPGHVYRARVRHQDTAGRSSHWSAPIEFLAAAPDVTLYTDALRITELHYHPAPATGAEVANGWEDADFEFIELQNIGAATIDLTDVRFTKGVDFDFPANSTISPGAYLLIVKNQAAFESRYGAGLPIAGEWASDNKLSNGGENLKLSLGAGTAIVEFTYDDASPWPSEPDGSGFSLTLDCPDATVPADHADPPAWRPSRLLGGTPGTDDHIDFATWAAAAGIGGGADPALDLDEDGMSNLLEYALASDATSSSTSDLPVAGIAGSHLTYTFRRQSGAKDLIFDVEFSTDLATWQSGVTVLVSRVYNADGTATEVWRTASPITGSARAFVRLEVDSP